MFGRDRFSGGMLCGGTVPGQEKAEALRTLCGSREDVVYANSV